MKNRELELQELCKDLRVEEIRVSPNPSKILQLKIVLIT